MFNTITTSDKKVELPPISHSLHVSPERIEEEDPNKASATLPNSSEVRNFIHNKVSVMANVKYDKPSMPPIVRTYGKVTPTGMQVKYPKPLEVNYEDIGGLEAHVQDGMRDTSNERRK